MTTLGGRVAILTGASHGLGPHIARALAKRGVHLALVARSANELANVAEEVRALGVRAAVFPTDLTDAAARNALLDRAPRELGPIDILINNAGADIGGRLHTRTAADVERIVQLNVLAPMELSRALLPSMLERRSGHVVHVSSLAGKVPMSYFSLYSATKYALVGFNNALQAELHGTGVRSSVVCPGFVSGDGMWARIGAGRSHPLLGVSTPERVARAVVHALETGAVEQIVAPRPVRPAVALWALAPRLGQAFYRLTGIDRFIRIAAEVSERE